MKAVLIYRERTVLGDAFVELVIWRLPRSLPGSKHAYKYRLALVRQGVCVIRTITKPARAIIATSRARKSLTRLPTSTRC